MKLTLVDDEMQKQVDEMFLNLKQNHPDIIDGIPKHCIEVVISDYLYQNKENKDEEELQQKMSAIKVKEECDLLSES